MESLWILFWWLMFGGSHMLGSSLPVRSALIHKLGDWGFKGLYSLVAFATFVPLCQVYAQHKHAGALLYVSGSLHHWTACLLMLAAIFTLVQGLISVNPLSIQAELSGGRRSQARGIERITRHPQNLSFALFGLAHMLPNPFVGDWIFFGGFILHALFSGLHQDRRTRIIGSAESRQFQAETSLIPFAAILSGKQRLVWKEFSLLGVLIAVVLYILLIAIHQSVFGGFV